MRKLLGYIRRACDDFKLIEPGDKICIGLSGGKDSLSLVAALSRCRKFFRIPFELCAVHLCMGLCEEDVSGMQAFCREHDVPLTIVHTQIGHVVLNVRKEKNPCSLCANMRRGVLHEAAKNLGCNKVALAHHRDDAIETLLLCILQEGRMHTFSPITYLDRSGITLIRPMVYAPEAHIIRLAAQMNFPILKSPCPLDGHTRRQDVKELIKRIEKDFPHAGERLFHALQNTAQYRLWDEPSLLRPPRQE
ncbi:MAG: tRNA lysidine(34) synthetase [Christensenellales bacterium]|jgi:tRNA 2-thiocytidine biosynthesis protein TtcA